MDEPITGIGIVESPSSAPIGYVAISNTSDGRDADIWKDSFFSRACKRYVCFTRTFPLDNGRWRNVVKDIVIDKGVAGSPPPVGYVVVSQTMSSDPQPALQGVRLCIKNEPREICQSAFCDLALLTKGSKVDKQLAKYKKIGDINGMVLYGKQVSLSPLSAHPQQPYGQPAYNPGGQQHNFNAQQQPAGNPYQPVQPQVQNVCRPENQWSGMTLERQKSEVLTTGVDGIEFQINSKYLPETNGVNGSEFVVPELRTKTRQELDAQFDYNLELEYKCL